MKQKISTNSVREALLVTARPPEFKPPAGVERSVELAHACGSFWTAALRRVIGGSNVADALSATREGMIEAGRSPVFSSECMECVRPHLVEAVARADGVTRVAVELDERASH
jgi:hypothetical protein